MRRWRAVRDIEVDVKTIRPAYFSLFETDALREVSTAGGVFFLSSMEIQKLTLNTVYILSLASIVITDNEVPLTDLVKGLIKAFKEQKNDELMQTIDGDHNKLINPAFFALKPDDWNRVLSWLSSSHIDY